jgi:hypothetical protein
VARRWSLGVLFYPNFPHISFKELIKNFKELNGVGKYTSPTENRSTTGRPMVDHIFPQDFTPISLPVTSYDTRVAILWHLPGTIGTTIEQHLSFLVISYDLLLSSSFQGNLCQTRTNKDDHNGEEERIRIAAGPTSSLC